MFLVLERAGLDSLLARAWRPLRHAYTLAVVTGAWVLFRCNTLSHAGAFFAALAGNGAATEIKYPLQMYLDPLVATTLVVALVGSMPIGRALASLADRNACGRPALHAGSFAVEWVWLAAVLLGSCAYLAAGTYNPFIYFRF